MFLIVSFRYSHLNTPILFTRMKGYMLSCTLYFSDTAEAQMNSELMKGLLIMKYLIFQLKLFVVCVLYFLSILGGLFVYHHFPSNL